MTMQRWVDWLLVGLLLAGCASAPAAQPATPVVAPAFPEVQLPDAPAELCRDATQLRLEPLLKGLWPAGGVATWRLTAADAEAALASGEWTPMQRDLLIAFPKGGPLPPGNYRVSLRAEAQSLLTHTFTIRADEARVSDLGLLLTPTGPAVERLPDALRVFYLHYRYTGVCPGAPLWVSVSDGVDVVCSQTLTLPHMDGEGAATCHREAGAPFAAGEYQATLTLTAPEGWTLDFKAGAPPPPPPPPPVYATRCEALFVAAGLDPQGAPLLPAEHFQWYTQGIYVGAVCQDLPPAAPWTARWYREGTLVREFEGVWPGAAEGIVWDSLTGSAQAPFLRSGIYAVTLAVSNTTPLTTTFRVVAYDPPATNP